MFDNDNELIAERRKKLESLRAKGCVYPNSFRRDSLAADLHAQHGEKDHDTLEKLGIRTRIAGRMMSRRIMGKAAFAHLQDMSGRIQVYVKRDKLDAGRYDDFRQWDLGDILGVEGTLFKTRTGELTVAARDIQLLAKSLRPLPEKFHGLTDQELRYRQRYLDLITNEDARRTFTTRSAVIDFLRRFLNDRGFVEVETPMMHLIPGGAAARPFVTHHNSLGMDLYLRIAPELFLKRLIIGGFEKVYEINRSFRNEGLSTRHNPEFTMLEFYQAYADYQDLMALTEEMLRSLVKNIKGGSRIDYQGESYDLGKPFSRLSVRESVLKFNPDLSVEDLDSTESLRRKTRALELQVHDSYGPGALLNELFEKTVEQHLKKPTFVTGFPTEVSPLARRSDDEPSVVDRFELFIGGREIANGFSELNDPEDQAERFHRQVERREAGDEEAMHYDEEFITALEYGMPPAAGEGIGIDRLVMLLTDSASIRDVILFPHMRPR